MVNPNCIKGPAHTKPRANWYVLLGLVLLWAVWHHAVRANETATNAFAQTPAVTALNEARQSIANASNLSEAEQTSVLRLYDQAVAHTQALQMLLEQTQTLEHTLQQAPSRLASLKQQQTQATTGHNVHRFDALNLEQLELEQSDLAHQLTLTRHSQHAAQTRLSRLLKTTQANNALLAQRKTALQQVNAALAQLPDSDNQVLTAAQRVNLQAQQNLYRHEIAYQQRLLDQQPLLQQLAQAERDHYSLESAALQSEIQMLHGLIQTHREQLTLLTRQSADTLHQQARTLPATLQQLAVENTTLSTEYAQVVHAERDLGSELRDVNQQLTELQEDFERTQQRVELIGHNSAISNLLRVRQSELPTMSDLQRVRIARDTEIADATQRQLEIDDALRLLAHEESTFIQTLQRANQSLLPDEQQRLEQDAQAVIDAYKTSLLALQKSWTRYINQLVSLDIALQNLDHVARDYSTYIDRQLFWMPSVGALHLLRPTTDPWLSWLTRSQALQAMSVQLQNYARLHPVGVIGGILLLFALWGARPRLNQYLYRLSQAVCHVQTDSIRWTIRAIVVQLLRVLAWPALLQWLAFIIAESTDPVVQAYAQGLQNAALLLLSLGLLREFARPNGVGASHFGWPAKICQVIESELRWFIPVGAVLAFLVAAYSHASPPDTVQAAGSLSFLVLMLAWIHVIVRLFGRRSSLRTELRDDFERSWVNQLYFIWYPMLVAIPAALALLSLVGYHYTAIELEARVQMTIWYLLSLYLLVEFALRWLYLAARRLKQARTDRNVGALQQESRPTTNSDADSGLMTPQLPEINYESLSEQSKRLVHAGFVFAVVFGTWSIWHKLLPALGVWQAAGLPVHEITGDAIGLTAFLPVTLVDILVGIFIIVLTILAARNIPGILEITLLQRLPLDHGLRYAITALTQYGIVGCGLLMAFSTMGMPWDKLQWLIAALGVGLGFGLQEIVANFVSGIILLFERPIRVGDVVTVDGTTGVVTRIQIRATTITNFDRQELIVPNKEFITNRLMNWTLSDKINRIILPVGVGYGTDVNLAMSLIREAAEALPEVLQDPAPQVTFESFGNDALMLYLRVYLANLDNRLATKTKLHCAILQKFRDANIEIPYAQHDVHVDINHPLDIRLHTQHQTNGT